MFSFRNENHMYFMLVFSNVQKTWSLTLTQFFGTTDVKRLDRLVFGFKPFQSQYTCAFGWALYLVPIQGSPVPLLKFQMAPRLRHSGCKKMNQDMYM